MYFSNEGNIQLSTEQAVDSHWTQKENRKRENMSLGILAFFTNIFRDEVKVLEIIFCYW